MSHPSLAKKQNVPAGPAATTSSAYPSLVFSVVDVDKASPEALKVIRGIGVPVSENIGWRTSSPSSTSSSSPPSDCSSPSSASDGQLEPASGPSRATKKSKTARRRAAGPRTRSKPSSDSVPRPSNCFFLFRQDFTKTEKGQTVLQTVEGKQNNLSRTAGLVWRDMSEEEKAPYRRMQEKLAREHKLRNPDYQFAPGRRGPTKKRVNKNKEHEVALSEYVARLHRQKLSADEIEKAGERFKREFKAKQAASSPTSSPSRSPIETPTPDAFVDPLYPPGDRTPQPRPAHPVVIELPPAPSTAPFASTSTSSSGSISSTQPNTYVSQSYPHVEMYAPVAPTPASWSAQAPVPSHLEVSAFQSAPTQYFTAPDAAFAYQQYPIEQGSIDFSIGPLDVYPFEHPMVANPLGRQQQILPDFDPTVFDNMPSLSLFDQPPLPNLQYTPFDAGVPYQPQFRQEQFGHQQQYPVQPMEQPWDLPAPIMDVPGLSDYTGFDVNAIQQQVTHEQQQFFAENGQFLYTSYSQGANVNWNA